MAATGQHSPGSQDESLFTRFKGALRYERVVKLLQAMPVDRLYFFLNRRLVSTPAFEECISIGRTAVEMPDYPLAPLQSSILACATGPSMGITNLSMEQDNPEQYDRGTAHHLSTPGIAC